MLLSTYPQLADSREACSWGKALEPLQVIHVRLHVCKHLRSANCLTLSITSPSGRQLLCLLAPRRLQPVRGLHKLYVLRGVPCTKKDPLHQAQSSSTKEHFN